MKDRPKRRAILKTANKPKQNPIDVDVILDKIDKDALERPEDKLAQLHDLRNIVAENLSTQQLIYVNEYLKDFNAQRAAVAAGYSIKYANHPQLKENIYVTAYVKVTKSIFECRTNVTAEFVVEEFRKLARVKISDMYKDGKLLPPHELPEHVSAAISEVKERPVVLATGALGVEYTYKFHSKIAALDALGKHVGIYERDNKQKGEALPQTIVYIPDNGRTAVEQKPTDGKTS